MAPRRRNRKPMRIDAAYAAMRPMGFEDRTVKKCVEKLLKVYGEQDEGWYFIEEASYKLLIDTLIEGDEESEPPLAITGGDGASSSRDGPLVVDQAAENYVVDEPSYLPLVVDQAAENYVVDEPSPLALVSDQAAENYVVDGPSSLPLLCDQAAENYVADGPSSLPLVCDQAAGNYEVECVVNYQEDIDNFLLEGVQNHVEEDIENYVEADAENYMEEDVDDKKAVVSLADIYDKCYALENGSQPQGNSAQAQPEPLQVEPPPRKPCYGWISDGSDDQEFISLTPEVEDYEDGEEYEDNEDS